MAETTGRKPPGPLVQRIGRLITKAVTRAPWTWRLLRRPVRRFFDGLAPGWDQRTRAETEERLAPIGTALDRLEREPASALDVGTGTGTGAFFLASRYPGAEVLGIDLSEAMIARANEKAAARGSSVRFEVADIAGYARREPFDLVLLLNMPAFFERTAALVAPGGYVVTIASRGPTTPFYTPSDSLDRGFRRRGLQTVATGTSGEATFHVAERPAT